MDDDERKPTRMHKVKEKNCADHGLISLIIICGWIRSNVPSCQRPNIVWYEHESLNSVMFDSQEFEPVRF
jgi:hypothetical protein